MDPAIHAAPEPARPLPRTRGDGPLRGQIGDQRRYSPPHARGWTRRSRARLSVQRLSPARAGMDPRGQLVMAYFRTLPRTRGDGPIDVPCTCGLIASPPHARGWTHPRPPGHRGECLSPARAGMDPRRRRPACRASSLPRTRGDGPDSGRATMHAPSSPPHARGWTHTTPSTTHAATLSPARAGMDPRIGTSRTPTRALPRTRGDGPAHTPGADAGADSPPHARGWTSSSAWTRGPGALSPARAGMDPSRS